MRRFLSLGEGIGARRVVAEHDQLDALETHHPVGLGPAPVVADAHPHDAVHGAEHGEAQVAGLEVALLEMLVDLARLGLRMAGDMDLAVLPGDLPLAIDQNGRVEIAL